MIKSRNLESARTELLEWCETEGNELRSEAYRATAAEVKQAAEGLERKYLTLQFQPFRPGHHFFYGVEFGDRNFYPISLTEGRILRWQVENEGAVCSFPIKDPKTNTYFVPSVIAHHLDRTPPENATAEDYLDTLVDLARMDLEGTEPKVHVHGGGVLPGEHRLQESQLKGGAPSSSYGRRVQAERLAASALKKRAPYPVNMYNQSRPCITIIHWKLSPPMRRQG